MAKRNLFEELKKSLKKVQDIKRTKSTRQTATIKSQKRKIEKDER